MSDRLYVLDASALLAVMLGEPGADHVQARFAEARVSAVNLSEVVAKLQERGVPASAISESLSDLDLLVIPFDADQAVAAGLLRQSTKASGLSLGDRACLALAAILGATAITTDRVWADLQIPIEIELAR